jgi:hypothetical protein
MATGAISMVIALLTARRDARRGIATHDQSGISTLHQPGEGSLRDVA